MPLPVGVHEVEILSHQIEKLADKPVIRFICGDLEGKDSVDFLVWLTPKAMGMARAALRRCGFDPDENITKLDSDPMLLRGKRVSVLVEDVNGRLRANLQINVKPTRAELVDVQAKLRAAKKEDEPALATAAATTDDAFPYGDDDGKETDDIPF